MAVVASINDMSSGRFRLTEHTTDLVGLMVIAGFVAVGAAGTAVRSLLRNFIGSHDRVVTVRTEVGGAVSAVVPDGFRATEVVGRLQVSEGTYGLWSVGEAVQMLSVAAIALAVVMVVNGARRGEPFVARAVRWMWIAAAACIVGQLGGLVSSIAELEAKHGSRLQTSTTTSFAWMGALLVFVALASVFRRGVALRDDAEHTI